MEEFLKNLNTVKEHNYVVKLKTENKKKDARIKQIQDECKNIVVQVTKEYKAELNKKITNLEEENKKLKNENSFYKSILDKIPKFILRIFIGKKSLLDKGE